MLTSAGEVLTKMHVMYGATQMQGQLPRMAGPPELPPLRHRRGAAAGLVSQRGRAPNGIPASSRATGRMMRSGVRDLVLAADLAGAVLRRDQTDIAHQPFCALEPVEVADLGGHAGPRERVQSTQAPQPYDCLPAQRAGHEPGDRAFQLVAPGLERVDRGEVVQQRRPDAAAEITATI